MRLLVVIVTLFGLATALWPGWLGPALLVAAGSLFALGAGFSAEVQTALAVSSALAMIGLLVEWILISIAWRRLGGGWRDLLEALAGGVGSLFVAGLLIGPLLGAGLWLALGGTAPVAKLTRAGQLIVHLIAGRAVKFVFAVAAAAVLLRKVFAG